MLRRGEPQPDGLTVLLTEARRRSAQRSGLLDSAFADQREFIEDTARRKAACNPRRSGKSWMMALYMLHVALSAPNSRVLYLALTKSEAKNIILKDVFAKLDEAFNLGIEVNLSDLTLSFPNGSTIRIDGADSSARRHGMFTGVDYDLVVIDEAQFWQTEMVQLIGKLEPAMVKRRGTICMIGVPDPLKTFFWEVVTDQRSPEGKPLRPGWSVHRWDTSANPHIAQQWAEELAQKLAENPGFVNTVEYKNQWLGLWVDDDSMQCYRYSEKRNWLATLPPSSIDNDGNPIPAKLEDYTWVLGADIGWSPDPFAFVVMGWKRDLSDHTLYITSAHKQTEMLNDDVKAYVDALRKTYKFSRYIIDGANGNVVADLQKRLHLPFEKADKGGMAHNQKVPWIHMMSDDLLSARVKLVGSDVGALSDEWEKLTWDAKTGLESKSAANHCADAALYGWKNAYNYVNRTEKKARRGTETSFRSDDPDWGKGYEQRLAHRMSRAKRALKDIKDWDQL
jgi:hypothetical protein